MVARWKLGRLLSEIERDKQGGRPSDQKRSTSLTVFKSLLDSIGLTKQTAMIAQRIGTLPEEPR
jgi:hypothetical protein